MANSTGVQVSINLAFPAAGVAFKIDANDADDGSATAFRLSVTDTDGGRDIPFRVDASRALADWVRGYSRWLNRARVSATFDENAITGTFHEGLTPEQTLEGVAHACDMIRQRFELYEESVLE